MLNTVSLYGDPSRLIRQTACFPAPAIAFFIRYLFIYAAPPYSAEIVNGSQRSMQHHVYDSVHSVFLYFLQAGCRLLFHRGLFYSILTFFTAGCSLSDLPTFSLYSIRFSVFHCILFFSDFPIQIPAPAVDDHDHRKVFHRKLPDGYVYKRQP